MEAGLKNAKTDEDKWLFQAALGRGPGIGAYPRNTTTVYTRNTAVYTIVSRTYENPETMSSFSQTIGKPEQLFGRGLEGSIQNVSDIGGRIEAVSNRINNASAAANAEIVMKQIIRNGSTGLSDNTESLYAAGAIEIENIAASEIYYGGTQHGIIPPETYSTEALRRVQVSDKLGKGVALSGYQAKRSSVDEVNYYRSRFLAMGSMQALYGEKVSLDKLVIPITAPAPYDSNKPGQFKRGMDKFRTDLGTAMSIYSGVATFGMNIIQTREKERQGFKVEREMKPVESEDFLKKSVFSPSSTIKTNPLENMLFLNSARSAMESDDMNRFSRAYQSLSDFNKEKDPNNRLVISERVIGDNAVQSLLDKTQRDYLRQKEPEKLIGFINKNNLTSNRFVANALDNYTKNKTFGNPQEVKTAREGLVSAVANYSPDKLVTTFAVPEEQRLAMEKGFTKMQKVVDNASSVYTHPTMKTVGKALDLLGLKRPPMKAMDEVLDKALSKPGKIDELGLSSIGDHITKHHFRSSVTTPKSSVGSLDGGTDPRNADMMQRANIDQLRQHLMSQIR